MINQYDEAIAWGLGIIAALFIMYCWIGYWSTRE